MVDGPILEDFLRKKFQHCFEKNFPPRKYPNVGRYTKQLYLTWLYLCLIHYILFLISVLYRKKYAFFKDFISFLRLNTYTTPSPSFTILCIVTTIDTQNAYIWMLILCSQDGFPIAGTDKLTISNCCSNFRNSMQLMSPIYKSK